MKYPKIKLAQKVIQYCKLYNVRHIIISPGSRNAPLTMGFYEDSFFKCFSIVDERSAAFFGLGLAQQIKHPVVVLCTSGSAVVNYYPAITEAFYSDIPLLVISADRPGTKIDIGDGQTIRQQNIFDNHSLYNANLNDDEKEFSQNEVLLQEAFTTCIQKNGPVHINAPFEEPLYEMIEGELPSLSNIDISFKAQQIPNDSNHLASFIKDWNQYRKKLILVGVQSPNEINKQVLELFEKDAAVIVMTETTSNLFGEGFFPAIDQLIAPIEKYDEEISVLQPEMLITFGGLIISKKIKAF